MPCPDTYPDIISVRLFISKQFPTLLAIREIIADAIVLPSKVIPPPCTQGAAEASVVYYNWQYLIAKIAKK